MSKTVALNINDVFALNSELQQLNREKELSFVVKYHLSKLLDKTSAIVKRFNESKLELIKKYGKEVEDRPGDYTLEGSEHFEKGMDELKQLIEVQEKFSFELKIDDFANIKSEVAYHQIFKFMQ